MRFHDVTIGIGAVLMLLLAGLGTSQLQAEAWRRNRFQKAPPYWLYDETAWRGLVRAFPVAVATGWACFGMFTATVLSDAGAIPSWTVTLFFWLFLGGWALGFSVFLFNQPKFIVPRWLRRQPGALATWFGRATR